MLHPVRASLLLLAVLLAGLVLAAPARANGILVTARPDAVDLVRRHPPTPTPAPVVCLEEHRVSALVEDGIASVTVQQVFRNHGGMRLEGTYLFPLPEGAVVSQFAMTMAGKMVQGEILERGEARRIYESIVRRRRDPGLLEYMGRGLFRARVFPIEPHQDLTIELTYQQVLPEEAGTLEFRYPLATDRLNATPVKAVTVDVKVRSSVDIKAIYSPSHTIEIQRDGEHAARVSYERAGHRQDKDLLLYVGRSRDAVGFSLLSHKAAGQDGTFMAVFAPRTQLAPEDRVPKDVVYVLDKSGSMAGPKLEQARKALQVGVRMLRPGDRFNVLAFSTGLHPFRDALVAADGEMQESAVTWIDGLQASGGTNIDGALEQALSMRSADRLFMVVFITDGRPTVQERDPDAIVRRVQQNNTGNTRIFTFGVGFDLDVGLLDRIAEATNGTRDYVTPDEDLEIVTGRFFQKVDQPVLSEVKVEFGPGVVDVYPQRLPDLFAGGQVVVFGRYRQAGARTLVLRGKLGAREVVHEHDGTFASTEAAPFLPRLWASRKVGFLLDEIRLHGENRELVDEVVRLATRYAIVTPYTAGLVVEESELQGAGDLPADARRARMGWREGGRSLGGLLPGASSAPAAEPRAPGRQAADSEELLRLKEAAGGEAHDDEPGDALGRVRALVRTVGGKTFVRSPDGRWVDKAWDGKQPTRRIEAWSKAYFELLKGGDALARCLALGDKVTFVHEEVVYEIVPAAP